MCEELLKMGFRKENGTLLTEYIDLKKSCHCLITGPSGSGKSVGVLYMINSLLNIQELELWIADFKSSGDFRDITAPELYAEYDTCEYLLEEFYREFQEIKKNRSGKKIMLIFDEYPSFCLYIGQDKKRSNQLQRYVSEILMQGRELPGGGSAYFWCLTQRPDSKFFDSGARNNFMVTLNFGVLEKETATMIGLTKEDRPLEYTGKTGTAVMVENGKPIKIIYMPNINKKDLIMLLKYKAAERSGGSCSSFATST